MQTLTIAEIIQRLKKGEVFVSPTGNKERIDEQSNAFRYSATQKRWVRTGEVVDYQAYAKSLQGFNYNFQDRVS